MAKKIVKRISKKSKASKKNCKKAGSLTAKGSSTGGTVLRKCRTAKTKVASKKKVTKKVIKKVTNKKKTWREFITGKMGKYMKTEGSHGAAMRRLSKEWKQYNK